MNKTVLLCNIVSMTIPVVMGIVLFRTETESKISYATRNIKNLSIDSEESTSLVSSSKEMINIQVKFDYDQFTYSKPNKIDDIDAFRNEMLRKGKEYHYQRNLELLDKLDITDFKNVYVSKYMPYFSFECENTELNDLYENHLKTYENKSYIAKVDIQKSKKLFKNQTTNTKYDYGINTYHNTYNIKGRNIKVGILESGIVDITHSTLANHIVRYDHWAVWETPTQHALTTANIIGGTNGLAPECLMYSAQLTGTPVDEFDWFLDNGVHIVNMSYGEANPTGYYNNDTAYIDAIVNTYGITCIAAAGNEGETCAYVNNPALGYNILGIGQCDNDNATRMLASSYLEETGPEKPNIMCRGLVYIPSLRETYTGTSCSSAIVSGVSALLMEKYPDFKLFPERLFSVLCATNDSLNANEGATYNGLRDISGVGGCLDPLQAYQNIINEEHLFFTTNEYAGEAIYLDLERGDRLKVSAWWRAYADGNIANTAHTDYDLILYDEYFYKAAESRFGRNNNEYFEIVITANGRYCIDFSGGGTKAQTEENYCVAWYIEPAE